MSEQVNLIERYRQSRAKTADYRLTNTICVAADVILKIEAGFYTPEQIDDAWEIVEAAIVCYAEGKRNETR